MSQQIVMDGLKLRAACASCRHEFVAIGRIVKDDEERTYSFLVMPDGKPCPECGGRTAGIVQGELDIYIRLLDRIN